MYDECWVLSVLRAWIKSYMARVNGYVTICMTFGVKELKEMVFSSNGSGKRAGLDLCMGLAKETSCHFSLHIDDILETSCSIYIILYM